MLQLATQTRGRKFGAADILSHVATESGLTADASLLQQCWDEVSTLLDNRDLAWLLTPATGARTFNEVPIQYRHGQQTVYGIIDRLVVTEVDIHLIDYKTHRIDSVSLPQQLAEHYKPQLELYREGIRRLWPDHSIKAYLLLTDGGMLVNIDNPSSGPGRATPR